MSYPDLLALLEAIVYVAKEPVGIDAILTDYPFELSATCRKY